MIFEGIPYSENLPFSISFSNVAQENKHCHKEIEVALILRGSANYQIYHMDYELNPGDLIIADVEDLHQIHNSSEDALILLLHVNTVYFEKLYPNIRYMFFVCEECMSGPSGNNQILQSKLALLKHCTARLALDYIQDKNNTHLLVEGITKFISILVNHFQGFFMEDYQYKTSQENISPLDLQRLSSITRYILLNYSKKITLDDVSSMEHLSSYYISHLVKKTLGFNFQSFVNGIRLEFAEKQLVFTNDSLMQISADCGFSSPNYFNKCFSAWYGKTPAQYRRDYQPCERTFSRDFTLTEALKLLTPYLNLSDASIKKNDEKDLSQQITILADFSNASHSFCGPDILLSSVNDLVLLNYCRNKIEKIKPSSFILDESLLKSSSLKHEAFNMELLFNSWGVPVVLSCDSPALPLKTAVGNYDANTSAASAISDIFNNDNFCISMSKDNEPALFTSKGVPTPFYSVYEILNRFGIPSICADSQYITVRGKDSCGFIFFNINPHTILTANILTQDLPQNFFMLKTEIPEEDNCYSILHQLENPETLPEPMLDRIYSATSGKCQFSAVNKANNPNLNIIVYQNSVTILEFFTSKKPHL